MRLCVVLVPAYAALAMGLAPQQADAAGTIQTIHRFTGGADGAYPEAALVAGPSGSFYGVAANNGVVGGGRGYGTVFQITPPATGQTAWGFTVLYTFTNGHDGAYPTSITLGADGALFGNAANGGVFNGVCAYGATDYGCGTIYKLAPPSAGQAAWTLTTLHAFTGGADGAYPVSAPAIDSAGALYGFTSGCGNSTASVCSTAFKLTPPKAGQTAWTETILHAFKGGRDGGAPVGTPLLDKAGTIYGVTFLGGILGTTDCGSNGCGLVFALAPPATGKKAWTKTTLLNFSGPNGLRSETGLTADAAGNLYGATHGGGDFTACVPGGGRLGGCGVAFKLSPPAAGATKWTDTTLTRFTNGADGSFPWDFPIAVGGNDYLTTSSDEVKTFGSIVELAPPPAGGTAWTKKVLFQFTNDANGCNPQGALVARNGVLYGTTEGDGTGPAPYGSLFAFKP